MARVVVLPGSATVMLSDEVTYLDPQTAAFEAMLDGWEVQQTARLVHDRTIGARVGLVRRLAEFVNDYPWRWTPGDAEAFMTHLRSGEHPIAMSTARTYEAGLRLFMDYVVDRRYGWQAECLNRFGGAPQQIFHEWNTIVHNTEYEGDPRRRPLTYDEVQALFDAADGLVEDIRALGCKGGLTAQRDAVMLKVIYAYGLRRNETRMLDVTDFGSNPKAPGFGRFGAVSVRYAKAMRGGPPRRRTVLTVPEMDWVVPVLEGYLAEVRPRLAPGGHAALFVTERCARVSGRGVNEAFTTARGAAGLPSELDTHCLRYSYVTHLTEFDYPQRFIQEQVGHRFASSTAVYTGVSDEYRNRLLQQSLLRRHPQLTKGTPT